MWIQQIGNGRRQRTWPDLQHNLFHKFYNVRSSPRDIDTVSSRPWRSLVRWSAPAFITAGIARIINAIVSNVEAADFVHVELIQNLSLTISFLAIYIGLLGFYPRLSERAPRLSLTALAVTVLGTIVAVIVGVVIPIINVAVGRPFTASPIEALQFLQPLAPLSLILVTLAFLLFGIVSYRDQVPSRRIGILLLVPVATTILTIVGLATSQFMVIRVATWILIVALLAIGYLLWSESGAPSGI